MLDKPFLIIGCVSHTKTLEELLLSPEKLQDCDAVELRLDEHMDIEACRQLCRKVRQYKPVLLTIRTNREGGTWTISDSDRYQLFVDFAPDVDMIDIELESQLFAQRQRSDFPKELVIIASYHDYENCPNDDTINAFIKRGNDWGIDINKLALTPKTQTDVDRLEALLPKENSNLCLIGMGALGAVTRKEFPLKGSKLTYGFLDTCAAPGQFSCKELAEHLK